MKICVIGGSGVIGSKICQYYLKTGQEVISTFNANNTRSIFPSHRLDITDSEKTVDFLEKEKPEVVFHTAAATNVDWCEINKKQAELLNVNGTENIISGCKKTGSKLVFLSTSFVFDGKKNGKYSENDKPNASTYYGLTKLRGEKAVKDSGLSYMILRTDQPYCWSEKWQHTNSILRLIETLQAGKNLNEIEDWYNTPTYVPDFITAAVSILRNNAEGIFHIVGDDFVNRYEWSLEAARVFGLDERMISPISSKELNLPVQRSNVNLKNDKVSREAKIRMKGVKEGASSMLKEMQP